MALEPAVAFCEPLEYRLHALAKRVVTLEGKVSELEKALRQPIGC
jgi:hypothetical protein